MNGISTFIGKQVDIEITGKTVFVGILIDVGLDIIVLFDGLQYLYIPLLHLHNIKLSSEDPIETSQRSKQTITDDTEKIAYRKVLNNAKGMFVEIYVTGNKSIHGYITNILTDYFVFYSPVYKTMFISLHHLKWMIPYSSSLTPYTLGNDVLPVQPSTIPLLRTFEEQLKKYQGKLVVFDSGEHPNKIGLLKDIRNNIVELITANGETMFWKLTHLKSAHLP
ncbi:DUF2642 domain-containing protein [Metabacillus herbersteinensis]|uniref:DUF2642 domain-containing protein n=1 Tax=Metabacillus herbersteinensis TaxID=283816 RepID=A0ABV6GGA8_9BACI